ncbi:MAG: CDGSH-type Zn-finger protein [Chlamydiales bacterium]|jgi:CDGSH-type Zn-finger protein
MPKPNIRPRENGPYLVDDLQDLRDASGPIESKPMLALCRCGVSARKPLCDGAHGGKGFSSARSEGRLPDRQDEYVGAQVTIKDNRAVCAHAGVCTQRLPAVWRMGQEPWIDPDGAPASEVSEVVQACPSGALTVSPASAESRGGPAIMVVKNGPYVVTGGVGLAGEEFGAGASDKKFTLCRCGDSKNKPFCDGAHWNAGDWDEAGT